MPVAKSFAKMTQICEPYEVNGKWYVKVMNPNGQLNTVRQVRWYSEAEHKKLYPELYKHENDPYYKSQKEVLGFKNGFITIFKGDTYPYKDWFKEQGAYYTRWWGWSFFSDKEVPQDLPAGVTAVRLDWDKVGTAEEKLYPDEVVEKVVYALTHDPSASNYQGEIGERLTLHVFINRVIMLENGFYGSSRMYIMSDLDGNEYVWTTSAKGSFDEGEEYDIRGTVKDHRDYKGVPQTVLTRCAPVKDKK